MSSSLFVWRDHIEDAWDYPTPDFLRTCLRCEWCQAHLNRFSSHKPANAYHDPDEFNHGHICPLCGWKGWHGYYDYDSGFGPAEKWWAVRILREFDINSSDLALSELGSYIKRRRASLFDLSWRRFEELVADVLREHGLRVELTKQSHDGGADVLVFSQGRKVEGIVQCKKWSATRKVGVETVRALIGAAIDWDVRQATLVTTSGFTSEAIIHAERYKKRGFAIDLKATDDLMALLGCYNEELPRLDNLSQAERQRLLAATLAELNAIYDHGDSEDG